MVDKAKSTVLCGKKNCSFSKTLDKIGFEVKVKVATYIIRGHIVHVYFYCPNKKLSLDAMLYSPYYPTKDHDAIGSTVKML